MNINNDISELLFVRQRLHGVPANFQTHSPPNNYQHTHVGANMSLHSTALNHASTTSGDCLNSSRYQNTQAFKEVAIIRHPRIGEYAFGFITSSVILQVNTQTQSCNDFTCEEELYSVYVPTNHLYIGDIFLVNSKDVIRPNLSVREGIEIVVSGGMSMPQILSTLDTSVNVERPRNNRS
ncbi:COV 1-like protein [Tanacetum coccineum]